MKTQSLGGVYVNRIGTQGNRVKELRDKLLKC